MINKDKPAFPKPVSKYMYATGSEVIDNNEDGISIRQYYAAKAMQGQLSCSREFYKVQKEEYENDKLKAIVKLSFQIADAMIAYENKENK